MSLLIIACPTLNSFHVSKTVDGTYCTEKQPLTGTLTQA